MVACITRLLRASLAKSTHQVYHRAWALFHQAMSELNIPFRGSQDLPLPVTKIIIYVGYLNCQNLSPSTILSYVSAIGYAHKFKGVPNPTTHTSVQKLLAAAHKFKPSVDARLPITIVILIELVQTLQTIVSNPYHRLLLQAMYVIAFFGLMRVGEITSTKSGVVALKLDQVQIFTTHVVLTISKFKHNVSLRPIQLVLPAQDNKLICPVAVLINYLHVRGLEPGPLFSFVDGAPVKRDFFINILKRNLNFCGLDSKLYKSHSFRIGGASLYASMGLSNAQIRLIGRWNSDAFVKYIRCERILLALTK